MFHCCSSSYLVSLRRRKKYNDFFFIYVTVSGKDWPNKCSVILILKTRKILAFCSTQNIFSGISIQIYVLFDKEIKKKRCKHFKDNENDEVFKTVYLFWAFSTTRAKVLGSRCPIFETTLCRHGVLEQVTAVVRDFIYWDQGSSCAESSVKFL